MSTEVRTARTQDVPAIEDVYLRSWRAAYADSLAPAALERLGQQRRASFDWTEGIRDPSVTVLVAIDENDAVVGVVQANERLPSPRDLPEITMLYVDPLAWGRGVGTALLAAATEWIAERGHSSVRLRVATAHGRARSLYERHGWTLDPVLEPITTDVARSCTTGEPSIRCGHRLAVVRNGEGPGCRRQTCVPTPPRIAER
jgi:GNAT superfamily N-acetyltransferase